MFEAKFENKWLRVEVDESRDEVRVTGIVYASNAPANHQPNILIRKDLRSLRVTTSGCSWRPVEAPCLGELFILDKVFPAT
jgi:hypothetical protein